MAISMALKQASMSGSGVPMIDEEGRPRPVKVKVEAAMRIEGSRNTVGHKASGAVRIAAAADGSTKRKGSSDEENEDRSDEEQDRVVKRAKTGNLVASVDQDYSSLEL